MPPRRPSSDGPVAGALCRPSVIPSQLSWAASRAAPSALVFPTSTGTAQSQTNVRKRVLAAAVTAANERLAKDERDPLPERLTPHSLRRTFASLLFAIGEPAPYVMAQLGHTTPGFTLAIYARQMDRRDGEPERLKALVEGTEHEAAPGPIAVSVGISPAR